MTAEGLPAAERPLPSGETGDPARRDPSSDVLSDPRALQILSTEHWSLLAGRSLSYNEAFARTGMFLTFLSASLIVIGFLVASDRFADAVTPIVSLLLAIDLFIGLATMGRLIDASSEELAAVRGMNRIRHAYAEMVPGIDRYFVSSIHDDRLGIRSAYGAGRVGPPPSGLAGAAHGLTTTSGMVAVINCVIVAALVAVVALGVGLALGVVLVLSVLSFGLAFIAIIAWGGRTAMRNISSVFADPLFPTPPES